MPDILRHALRIAASLRLTVACLGLAMVLVLAGTFGQVTDGLYLAQDRYFRSLLVWTHISGVPIPILPGGRLLGAVLVINLLAAHITRFRRSWAKLGIHLIHLGLFLLILGQVAADFVSTESRMTLDTGQTRDWSESPRETELVFLSDNSKSVTVPGADLKPGRTLRPGGIPFDLRFTDWHANAALVPRKNPPADAHAAARQFTAQPRPRETRLDRRDLPAVEFELLDRATGESLGHWLAPLQLDQTQTISGWNRSANRQPPSPQSTTWQFQLRPRRIQHRFSLTLDEFIHERHRGTDIPSRFVSRLTLRDATGDSRPVLIHMNHPLRIAGRTIYQSSFANDDRTSILQVVQNPGWMTPYVACVLITLGLLIQFGQHLNRVSRPASRTQSNIDDPPAPSRSFSPDRLDTLLPALALAAVLAALIVDWTRHTTPRGRLASIPVQANGRIQPLDALARNSLILLSAKSHAQLPDGTRLAALDWLLTLVADPATADAIPVFRITHPDVLTVVGQPPDEPTRLTFDELRPHLDAIHEHARSAADLSEADPYRRAILQLDNALHTYAALRLSFRAVTGSPSLAEELAVFTPLVPTAIDNAEAWKAGQPHDRDVLSGFVSLGRAYRNADRLAMAQPAWAASAVTTDWTSLPGALLASVNARQLHPAPALYAAVLRDPVARDAIDALASAARAAAPAAAACARSESLFHALDLFSISRILYLAAFLVAAVSFFVTPAALRTAAWRIAVLALLLTTAGLIWRIALIGRPPVTNLYSSSLFVAWVAVGLGLLAERFTRDGIVTAAASALGFASLLIAHHLVGEGDTMGVLIAVLDSNFWLATHVIAITIGYAATFLAGFLGIAFLILRVSNSRFDFLTEKRLATMIYGVICFALLFSFVGTILGGIWADQSWGRFWGWDPKENGALLIVLWNALILHARWGGFILARGLAVLAVLGNVVTAFSWFGTNLLGIGLHSYGFTQTGFLWLAGFTTIQLVVTLLAAAPAAPSSASVTKDEVRSKKEEVAPSSVVGVVTKA
jgi:ABC-type transport system involved in cytochrome c biogenesis permease subunit